MRKRDNPTATSYAGLFLFVVKFNFYPLFFLERTFLYFYDGDDSIQIWRFKVEYTPHLKNLVNQYSI